MMWSNISIYMKLESFSILFLRIYSNFVYASVSAFLIASIATVLISMPLNEWCYIYPQDHIYLGGIICRFIQEILFVIDIST